MSVMDVLKRWSEKKSEKSEKFKQLEEDYRLQKMLEQRQKSSNERELERYMKEQREKNIKKQLDIIRKQKKKEMWKGNQILKGGTSILKDNKKLLSGKGKILHQKNIFLDNKTKNPITEEELFFKW